MTLGNVSSCESYAKYHTKTYPSQIIKSNENNRKTFLCRCVYTTSPYHSPVSHQTTDDDISSVAFRSVSFTAISGCLAPSF